MLVVAGSASADPILELPGRHSPHAAGTTDPEALPGSAAAALTLLVEMNALAPVVVDDAASYPEVDSIDSGEPELSRMRLGVVGQLANWPLAAVLRLDASEGLRLEGEDFEQSWLAASGAIIDDLYVAFTPAIWAQLWLGRQPVVFSRFRHGAEALHTSGAVPFVIDRIAPDRRWGAAFHGDLGALSYAGGAYLDGATTELGPARADYTEMDGQAVLDPSIDSRYAVAGHVEWIPRAPMGRDRMPSPTTDPWFATPRASAGLGVLWRSRDDDVGHRLDVSLSAAGKLRQLASLVELLLAVEGHRAALGIAGELSYLPMDRLLVWSRAEYDRDIDIWSAGAGIGWFLTGDRWNRISLYGFARRARPGDGPTGDGVILQLQTAL